MKATLVDVKALDSRLKKAAEQVLKLNEQVAEGSEFFQKFESLLRELPDNIVSLNHPRGKKSRELQSLILVFFPSSDIPN
jgi:hypothetical protein